ncbi:MAG: hypothetical protein IT454_09590 [Planctomycetes bacterium]|nr:hypothetical protein [Planctomycetota bacterium]
MRTLALACVTGSIVFGAVASCSGPAAREQAPEPALEVVVLRFASAQELAQTLGHALQSTDLRITADSRTNRIVLIGAPADVERAESLIGQLDVEVH